MNLTEAKKGELAIFAEAILWGASPVVIAGVYFLCRAEQQLPDFWGDRVTEKVDGNRARSIGRVGLGLRGDAVCGEGTAQDESGNSPKNARMKVTFQ